MPDFRYSFLRGGGHEDKRDDPMVKFLTASASALAVCALFLAPAAMVTVISADSAYANNGNGKGGGNGNGGENRGAGKSGDKGDKSARNNGNRGGNKAKTNKGFASFKGLGNKSKNKSARLGNLSKDLKNFGNAFKKDVGGLFGVKQKTTRSYAVKEKGTLHPSNLGKLNGAINSSPRAKEAHIANGQYANGTGPVSLAAALAVADYQKAGLIDVQNAFDTVNSTSAEELADATGAIEDYETNPDTEITETEYKEAVDLVESVADAQNTINAAAEKGITEDNIDAAVETAHVDVETAEDNLLAHYKGDLPPPDDDSDMRLSEEEQEVVDTVRASNPDEETVGDILGTHDVEEEITEGDGESMTEEETDSAMILDEPTEG